MFCFSCGRVVKVNLNLLEYNFLLKGTSVFAKKKKNFGLFLWVPSVIFSLELLIVHWWEGKTKLAKSTLTSALGIFLFVWQKQCQKNFG